jgi:hypothetical protein
MTRSTRNQSGDRGPDLRALADVFPRRARFSRLYRRGKADVQAGIAAPRAHASGPRPQIAVFVLACRRHPRHERAGSAAAIARSRRACDATGIRLRPQMEDARSRDVGQSPNYAPRPPLRPVATPRHAPRYGRGHRPTVAAQAAE